MSRLQPLFTWRSAICESDLPAVRRHVALTLSLYMNERGGSAHPGARRLAADCGLSERAVRLHLRGLVEDGWLRVVAEGGRKGEAKRANEFAACTPEPRLPIDPADAAPGPRSDPAPRVTRAAASPVTLATRTPARDDTSPVTHVHPNSPENSPENSRGAAEPAAGGHPPTSERRRDELFETVAAVCGIRLDAIPDTERGRLNRACRELRAIGATPADVRHRAGEYRARYRGADLTPQALTGNWARLAPAQARAPARRCDGCGQILDGDRRCVICA